MAKNSEYKGKTVFITGAAQGVGYATARRFAEGGASLALVDLSAEVRDKAQKLTAEFDVAAEGIVANVQSAAEVQSAVSRAVEQFGGIDVAANVAGIFPMNAFEAQAEEDMAKVMDINFFGTMRVCQSVIPIMRKRKGCSIVNVISGAAFLPMFGYTAYCASKGAVLAASRSLAVELAPDIRLNMVSPGATTSESVLAAMGGVTSPIAQQFLAKVPMGVFATPDDIANAIFFLGSSERAGHITGATLQVNGGALMS
jgi:3-oxoacyl-[acyl-carrier protein] reductase